MPEERLVDQLRKATRNFTAGLPETDLLALGAHLLQELARAHSETPPRHPDLDPRLVPLAAGVPVLDGDLPGRNAANDLFDVGCLLISLASATPAHVSWQLDGPPVPELSTLLRRSVLQRLAAPDRRGFGSAQEALASLRAALAAAPATAALWPLFRGDIARTGSGPLGGGQLLPLWHAAVGPITASPVVVGQLVIVPAADGRLLFVERHSGRVLHEHRLGSAVESSPAVADGRLWVGTDDGELVAIDVASGRETLRLRLGRMVRSSPLPVADTVVVGVLSAKGDGAVVALRRDSGKTVWTRPIGAAFSSPSAAGDVILIGSDRGALHALDAAKGTPRFTHQLGGKVRATPAIAGGLALVGDFDGRLAAVRVADGTRAWTLELGQSIYSSACVVGDLCIVGCHDGRIHGVDVATGALRFALATRGPVVSSAAGTQATLLVGSTDGSLYVFDAAGTLRQRLEIAPGGTQSSPAFGDGAVYLGSERGLHAWSLTA